MKNSPLLVLLGVSVLANIAFVVRPWMTSTDSAADSVAKSSPNQRSAAVPQKSAPARASAAAESKNPVAWRSLNSDDDLRSLAADLRAAGFPAKAIRAIVEGMLREQMQAGFAKLPFWQRLVPNKDILAQRQAAARDLQTKLEQILGPDGRQSVAMDPVLREQRYGPISDDKLDAVLKIERDYEEMQANASRTSAYNLDDIGAQMEQYRLLTKEKLSDLASLLSPAELEAYELRNSNSARRVQEGVRNLEVSDEEYTALFRLQKTADSVAQNTPGFAWSQRPVERLALNEQMRAVLPDERFYKFLEGSDPYYFEAARFAEKNPTINTATTYQVYQLQIEAQAVLGNLSRQSRTAGAASPAAAELASKLAAYNARLNTLLGPDLAAAYRKQPLARIFTPPASPKPTPGGG